MVFSIVILIEKEKHNVRWGIHGYFFMVNRYIHKVRQVGS